MNSFDIFQHFGCWIFRRTKRLIGFPEELLTWVLCKSQLITFWNKIVTVGFKELRQLTDLNLEFCHEHRSIVGIATSLPNLIEIIVLTCLRRWHINGKFESLGSLEGLNSNYKGCLDFWNGYKKTVGEWYSRFMSQKCDSTSCPIKHRSSGWSSTI